MRHLLLAACLLCLPACADELRPRAGVTVGQVDYVVGEKEADPRLEAALAQALALEKGQEVRYLYNRVELKDEGTQFLVLLTGQDYGGSGGQTALVFDEAYRPVTRFTLVNGPIVVGPGAAQGWKDLTWLVAGGGVQGHYATLRFTGKGYPTNPSMVPATAKGTVLTGKAYLADPLGPQVGLKLKRS